MPDDQGPTAIELASRRVPLPAALSDAAKDVLTLPRPAQGAYPALGDKDGWRRLIAARDKASAELSAPYAARLKVDIEAHPLGGVPVYRATPRAERLIGDRHVIFDIHGGALLFGGGEANVRFSTAAIALRTGRVAYGVDYRVPPTAPTRLRSTIAWPPTARCWPRSRPGGWWSAARRPAAISPPRCCCGPATKASPCRPAHCC